jgi:Mn-dependent DtxR family transcriptional regulator
MDNEKTILDALEKSEKPLKAGDVADLTGIAKEDVSKIFKKLKNEEKIISPKACFYTVKK